VSDGASFGLDVEGVVVDAGGATLVRVDAFAVSPGEVVVVAGPSGAGKSTFMRALLGAAPASGVVRYARYAARDRNGLKFAPDHEGGAATRGLRARVFGYVPQAPETSLDPLASIGAEFVAAARRAGRSATLDDAASACASFGVVSKERVVRSRPFEISGGEAQRAALAIAVAGDPPILLLDEPTSSLDPAPASDLLAYVRRGADEGRIGAVVVTHDPRVAAAVADRVVVLDNGRVVESADVAAFFERPTSAAGRAFLAAATPPPRARLFSGGVGEEFLRLDSATTRRRKGVFGRVATLLYDASLVVRSGETTGIVGESGSGKSSLARLLTGVDRPSAGRMYFAGDDVSKPAVLAAARRATRLCWQDVRGAFDPRRAAGDAAYEALRAAGVERAEREGRVLEAARAARLDPALLRRRPAALSGGERARALLVATLAADPPAAIFDESFAALDGPLRAEVVAAATTRRDGSRRTSLLVSHDLALIAAATDRVVVVSNGRPVESGPTADVFENPAHPATRRLLKGALPKKPSDRAAWLSGRAAAPAEDDRRCYGPHAPWREIRPGHFAAADVVTTS
jgi:peptide/nickel transport system ATP-binding protein